MVLLAGVGENDYFVILTGVKDLILLNILNSSVRSQ
jgi:hypothetical protein